jgi:hypothetical protein
MTGCLLFLSLCALVLTGCATGRLYPIKGPLSAQTPPPIYVANFKGAFNSGDFTVTLGDGEVCKGRWQTIHRPKNAKESAAMSSAPDNSLSAEWDIVYGPGFYVAHVLGARLYAHATLTGSKGTTLNVEMYKPNSEEDTTTAAIKGVAKDNKDNIYKLAF